MTEIILIAAISKKFVIGKDGGIPWYISADFKRFKELTINNCVIMGRKTFESLPIKPLPKRENIVLSSKEIDFKGITSFKDYKKAVDYAKEKYEKVFIIGGYSIFKEGLKYATKLELTILDKKVEGDTFFPKFDENEFKEINRVEMNDEKEGKYWFVTYEKIS